MKQTTSPSQRIYDLYAEYERKGMDASVISRAIQEVTGTTCNSNLAIVSEWIDEIAYLNHKQHF